MSKNITFIFPTKSLLCNNHGMLLFVRLKVNHLYNPEACLLQLVFLLFVHVFRFLRDVYALGFYRYHQVSALLQELAVAACYLRFLGICYVAEHNIAFLNPPVLFRLSCVAEHRRYVLSSVRQVQKIPQNSLCKLNAINKTVFSYNIADVRNCGACRSSKVKNYASRLDRQFLQAVCYSGAEFASSRIPFSELHDAFGVCLFCVCLFIVLQGNIMDTSKKLSFFLYRKNFVLSFIISFGTICEPRIHVVFLFWVHYIQQFFSVDALPWVKISRVNPVPVFEYAGKYFFHIFTFLISSSSSRFSFSDSSLPE